MDIEYESGHKPAAHEVLPDNASYHEKIVRVPLVKITLPNPAGTSAEKYEPEYVIPLLFDLWKPKFQANPMLKPKVGVVPAHLPKFRDITSVEDERGRLEQTYGRMRSIDETRVDHFLPGDKLWQEIKRVKGQIGVRLVTTHHSFHVEESFKSIPATVAPFDILDELPFDIEYEGEGQDQEIETEESVAKRKAAEKLQEEKMERARQREAYLSKRAQLAAKAEAAKARVAELRATPSKALAPAKDEGDNEPVVIEGETVEPDAEDLAAIDAADRADG